MADNGRLPDSMRDLIQAIKELTAQEQKAATLQEAQNRLNGVSSTMIGPQLPFNFPSMLQNAGAVGANANSNTGFWNLDQPGNPGQYTRGAASQFLASANLGLGGQLAQDAMSGPAGLAKATARLGGEMLASSLSPTMGALEGMRQGLQQTDRPFESQAATNQRTKLDMQEGAIRGEDTRANRFFNIWGGGVEAERAIEEDRGRRLREIEGQRQQIDVGVSAARRTEQFFQPFVRGRTKPDQKAQDLMFEYFREQEQVAFDLHKDIEATRSRLMMKPGTAGESGKR